MNNDEITILFTMARMNPPTPGHLYVIQQLIQEAIRRELTEVYVILSKSNEDQENPISCSQKIDVLGNPDYFMSTMIYALKQNMIRDTKDEDRKTKIENIQVNLICIPEEQKATPFTALIQLITPTGKKNETNFTKKIKNFHNSFILVV
jgi:hypothetical protein